MRSALRRQPSIPALARLPKEAWEWAGNPSLLHIRFRLWSSRKSPKASGLVRKYSCFPETIPETGSITTARERGPNLKLAMKRTKNFSTFSPRQ